VRRCRFERLSDRLMLHGGSLADALPIEPDSVTAGQIAQPAQSAIYEITLSQSGRLTLQTQGQFLNTRTSLLSSEGRLLIQSDGRSPADPTDSVVQHLLAGTYFVNVEGLAGSVGRFALTADFQRAIPPQEPLQVNFDRDYPFALMPPAHTAGDFNGDGLLDVATANDYTNDVSVLLGVGDGTFQPAQHFAAGFFPFAIVSADFDADGALDLATANQLGDSVSILFGRGDGTFDSPLDVAAGTFSWGIGAGDFNEDGRADLVTINLGADDVSILIGRGDGTFEDEQRFAAGQDPGGLELADLDRDGHLDVVVGNFESHDVSVLLGRGNGTLEPERRFSVGEGPTNRIAVGDYDGDGHYDLATANSGSDDVAVLLGDGQGGFAGNARFAVGTAPFGVVSDDFDGDGRLDLASVNRLTNDVAVLLGRGDGTFDGQVRYRVGLQPWNILLGDFNGDGKNDLATVNSRSHDVSVLVSRGDGTFVPEPVDHGHGESNPQGMVARDFNEDGYQDLVTVSYTGGDAFVYLGRGDGTFQQRARYEVGSTPVEVVAGDFNGDGHFDIATANCDTSDTSVLLGRGDGTFSEQVSYPASASSEFILAGDFNGDGLADLVSSGQFANGAALLLGRGDGSFSDRLLFAQGDAPADSAAADFNGDGHLDVAFANYFSPDHDVAVYFGGGDGTFTKPERVVVGEFPLGVVTGDFNRDGHPDLAATNFGERSVSVLLGRGNGTFEAQPLLSTGNRPDSVLARDVDGDGALDLVISNAGTDEVSLFLGRGDGKFDSEQRFLVGDGPTPRRGLETADFNGDGRLDVAIPQVLSNDVSILLGGERGQFEGPLRFAVGLGPVSIAVGDTSGDGRLDVASVNPTTSELTIFAGAGDGTLRSSIPLRVGDAPVAVVQADFNRDGRLDVATANQASDDISVLLGLGTGDFQDQQRILVGTTPSALVAGDFNGDGQADLAVANSGSGDLSIILGRANGTFHTVRRVPAGELPQALATGDFNRDGRLDLAVADYRSDLVLLLAGRGDGTFLTAQALVVGRGPVALIAADVTGDGWLDLASANYLSNDVTLLAAVADGSFVTLANVPTGTGPVAIAAGDYNRDGRADLATANSTSDDVTLLQAGSNGIFAAPQSFPVGDYPVSLVSADFNDDARLDLALATQLEFDVSVLQGLGDGTFAAAETLASPRLSSPLAADWNGDGAADTVVLNRDGKIFLRFARPDEPGLFQAPVIVNPGFDLAARDMAFVHLDGGLALAALDVRRSSISLYTLRPGDTPGRIAGPAIPGMLPAAIAAGDLNGDGRDDLAVVAAGSRQLFVYFQGTAGFSQSAPDLTLPVGASPSSLELSDISGDGRLDIAVTNRFSGDVSVLVNDPSAPFASELRYRTAEGLFSLTDLAGSPSIRSSLAPTDVLGGDFNLDGAGDLLVANAGINAISVLHGMNSEGVANPADDLTYATGLHPLVMAAGSFNGDAFPDLAVLNEASADVSIFLGTSDRKLAEEPIRPAAGNVPTGLVVHDINGDGRQDLIIGNDFGDLLVLRGNGDGTFQPYQRADGRVALAIADVDGDGREDFIFASQAADTIEVQYSQSADAFRQARANGVLAPEAIATSDLNRDGAQDLIVANSGANNVLVYLGTPSGQFAAARSYFAGTNPVSVTVDELNGDALPDLIVANEGSNDVTVLLGQVSASGWTLAGGPRLRAGSGPVHTMVSDETRDGVPDILVTNKQSNDVYLLAGLGLGFFNDRDPVIHQTGQQPDEIVRFPDGGFATINVLSSDITFFRNFLTSPGFTFGSGGERPVAGIAGDFNGDALSDLLVAHQGSGAIRMLVGGPGGFSLAGSFSHADLPHPAALASVFRGGQIEIYAVNEHGSQAVLAALIDPSFRPSDPAPIPLVGLLLVVAPGFELAMSVLTAEAVALNVQAPAADQAGEPASNAAPPALEEGAGSAELKGDEEHTDPDTPKGEETILRDAAILDLLAGVEDALALRPPKLSRDENTSDLQTEEPGGSAGQAAWFEAALDWISKANWPALLQLLPLPPGMSTMTDAALHMLRQWFPAYVATQSASVPAGIDSGPAAIVESATDELMATESWGPDSWRLAIGIGGLAGGAWVGERDSGKCRATRPRRARFPRRPRPTS
jgi:hypothetical protein